MDFEPIAYGIADAVKAAGVGRTKLYELISSGEIDARKSGKKVLIIGESLRAYVARLPKAVIRLTGRRAGSTGPTIHAQGVAARRLGQFPG